MNWKRYLSETRFQDEMRDDFQALRTDVETAKEYLYDDDPSPYISFVKDYYGVFDRFFLKALEALESICAEDGPRPEDKVENVKNGAYQGLQRVRQIRSALHSPALPIELYYLLEDIKDDLEIDTVIGLDPGSNPDRKFLIEKMGDRFRILKKVAIWTIWDGKGSEARVINMPRSELFQPLSYTLLAHECFHLKEELIGEVTSKLGEMDAEIDENHFTEIAVDLLTLNYMGPVYAERLIRIPDKIGEHESYSYPNFSDRIGYSKQYIGWLLKERGYDAANLPIQSKLDQTGYKSKFIELEEYVFEELETARGNGDYLIPQEEFIEFQEWLSELLVEYGIRTYDRERQNVYDYLGMPEATTQTLSDKLDKFLLGEDRNNVISLPVKPTLLLNLLLIADSTDESSLQEVILLSFKKWYVTNKTREGLS